MMFCGRQLFICSMIMVTISINRSTAINRTTFEDLTNTCMDGRNHKTKPGPESNLFNYCLPWKNRSCCTEQVAEDLHVSDKWYNFDWNHCGTLSPECRSHFLQDLCFYECSPNVAPWLEPVKMKIRNEKFMHVPFCESDCNNWWNDCKNELTCVQNWGKHFNWSTGSNICPTGTTCKSFTQVYKNSSNFCETIWNYSWKVVPETENCMHLWFDSVHGNPNDKVALAKAAEILGLNKATHFVCGYLPLYSILGVLYYIMYIH